MLVTSDVGLLLTVLCFNYLVRFAGTMTGISKRREDKKYQDKRDKAVDLLNFLLNQKNLNTVDLSIKEGKAFMMVLVPSQSEPDKQYTVEIHADEKEGYITCDCPCQGKEFFCKHELAVLGFILKRQDLMVKEIVDSLF